VEPLISERRAMLMATAAFSTTDPFSPVRTHGTDTQSVYRSC
jgi:hypothetical protein